VRLTATDDDNARGASLAGARLANEGRFDYLPVDKKRTDHLLAFLTDLHSKMNVYNPIGPSDLISAETSLLQFVWTANEQSRRLVLEGTEVRGIVTLSDIQKLPVRIALFSLFIHFELLLTEHLRAKAGNKDPLSLLSAARVDIVGQKWHRFKDSNMDQDIFSAMDLCDKREAAQAMEILGKSKTSIKSAIWEIENICATR
jgi:hypothetical protein